MTLITEAAVSDGGSVAELQLQLFGPLNVRVQGASLPPLHSRKGSWLLALLVLKHDRPIDRSWFAATLWPDSNERESLKNLRNTLHDLRRALGSQANCIHSLTPGTLSLDIRQVNSDLLSFDAMVKQGTHESLEKAVALYRGSLLEGCDEEWIILERAQRQQACLDALELLAHIELEAGAVVQACRRLRACVSIDAFRETAQRALMTALASSGDYAGVTQVYREFRLLLHEQLQTQPAADTTALYQTIRVRARQAAAGGATPLSHKSPRCRFSDLSADPAPEDLSYLPAGKGNPHNLPPPLTSFIGREKECTDIKELLAQTRLLTLTGSGGSGKTRLSLEVAGETVPEYPNGVWLVELASLADSALVVQAVAAVLDIREQPGASLRKTLVTALRTRTLLLLLDNCEHMLAACVELAAELLRTCPGVRLLATSRERLHIAGEQTYRVPSLSLPAIGAPISAENIHQYESVRLFEARACLTRCDFRVTRRNAEAVANVCQRLDGIPLAIELAAARVGVLTVEDLQRRLDDCFHLLTDGDRSALPRQRTLRGLIDWSYDLLNDSEKRLLQRLSVFAGGWMLEAAEAVCKEEDRRMKDESNPVHPSSFILHPSDVLDLLTSLVDKSLVIAEERYGTVRYFLLETVRQFARDRLVESGESDDVSAGHLAYFLAFAVEAEPKLTSAEQGKWFVRLEAEHDNLRSALEWCRSRTDNAEAGLQLAGALSRFWRTHGLQSEGRACLTEALRRDGAFARTPARSRALNGAGILACDQGDYKTAQTLLEEALTINRECEDYKGIALSLNYLGNVARLQGKREQARSLYEESLALSRQLSNRHGISICLSNLGIVAMSSGDYGSARALYEESLAIRRELRDLQGIVISLTSLGNMAYLQGDYGAATALFDESLVIGREIGDRGTESLALNNKGLVALAQGKHETAKALFQQSLGMRKRLVDKDGIAASLNDLGRVAFDLGDHVTAKALCEESLSIRRDLGNKYGIAASLCYLGMVVNAQGDAANARTLQEEGLALRREQCDMQGIAASVTNLGYLAYNRGDYCSAADMQKEGLATKRELGDKLGIVESLEALADVAAAEQRIGRALRLWSAAQSLRDTLGSPMTPNKLLYYTERVTLARSVLGDTDSDAAWSEGSAMTIDNVIAYALADVDKLTAFS